MLVLLVIVILSATPIHLLSLTAYFDKIPYTMMHQQGKDWMGGYINHEMMVDSVDQLDTISSKCNNTMYTSVNVLDLWMDAVKSKVVMATSHFINRKNA